MENSFKQIESDAICPPHLKEEIVSEIDLIRNVLTVVELYSGDFFSTFFIMLSAEPTTV